MVDRMRWQYGDTNPVVAAVDSETVIEIGDLLWQDVGDAKPASSCVLNYRSRDRMIHAKDLDIRLLQEKFADGFLGVAMQRSRNGETAPIRVSTTGVFEYDCEPTTFELGDLVGVRFAELTQGPLFNQQVVKTYGESRCAIGRVAKREAKPVTEVLVDIRSTVMGVFRP